MFQGPLSCGATEQLTPNIAPNGVASQISDYSHSGDLQYARHANDGNFGTNAFAASSKCAITKSETGAWWQLDLLVKHDIPKVGITTRDSLGKLSSLPYIIGSD